MIITLANVDRFCKILSPTDSLENSLCIYHKDFQFSTTLLMQYVDRIPCESRISKKNVHFDSILSKLLTVQRLCSSAYGALQICLWLWLWRIPEDCWHWLTDQHFEVCQMTSRINSWTLFSWTLLHHGDFYTMIRSL